MNQEYMKEKPVLPLILSMSTPMMLSMLVQSLYNIIDSIFVAKIGEDALAAVSLVYPLQNLITALTVGFGVGMNARIAFYLGAGEKEKADTATSQGIFLGTVHGILVTIAGLFFAPVYLRMYTQDERVLSWSIAYANIIFGMSALLVVGVTFEKVYQVSLNEAMILCALQEASPNNMTATSLSKRTELTPSHASKMLRILEEKELIVRTLGEEDRRLMQFHLSQSGKKLVRQLALEKVEIPELLKPLFESVDS